MSQLFLGLDCSTQSFTTIIIDFQSKNIIFRNSINFDEKLHHYHTKNGVYFLDEETIHSNPLMWVEALELSFKELIENGIKMENIKAISGSGQQHGTVYLNKKFEKRLQNLNSDISLIAQLQDTLSRQTSPIWMDSSTSKQCEEIRTALGGLERMVEITGSNSMERFSGPQIRKFYQENHEAYAQTTVIHLVSSFLASLLLGRNASLDHGDGSGMNLMNIKTKKWDKRALKATAPSLKKKLPNLCEPFKIIGELSPYFIQKYNFSPKTKLIAWSGDNPNSLIGVGLTDKGKVAISLGTSDTYFSYMEHLSYDLKGESHVFGAPTGDYMSLICFKNGSLAREKIKDRFNLSWEKFSEILKETPPGNKGNLMLPYFFPEVVPLVLKPKVYRFGFDENDLKANVRALIEAQFLSMKHHSEWIQDRPKEIYATGGGSRSRELLRVAAEIFNANVRVFKVPDSAALGASLRSIKSYYDSLGKTIKWSELVDAVLDIQNSEIIRPTGNYKNLYEDLTELYRKYEEFILEKGKNPELLRIDFINKYFREQK